MKIFNTLSKQIEEFIPINPPEVKLFVCGPTVYDFAHIGNAKTYTQFDFIVRYLRYRKYNVNYVMNITNIDDKIIKRAQEQGIAWDELSRKYEEIFLADMESMHNTSVSKYARATDFIEQIVGQVKTLVAKGYGYETSDGIYFDLSKFSNYGKLSKRTEEQRDDGVSRIDESSDKRNRNDFCLWKKSKPGEPVWETEIGSGRPGWHIEDTAITETLLGPQYDVHGGAIDLIFPHHEAEIAQMESASGKSPLVKYWIHGAFLNMNADKMSKSRGNFVSMREAIEKYGYRQLRFFFVSNHYRTTLEWSDASLEQSNRALSRIDAFVSSIDKDLVDDNEKYVDELREMVIETIDNDFDTPKAIALIFDFIREQNKRGKAGKSVYNLFLELNEIFDVFDFSAKVIPDEIKALIEKRNELRNEKRFDEADKIREEIERAGYSIEDTRLN